MFWEKSSPDLTAGFREQVESALNALEKYRQNYQQIMPSVNEAPGNILDAEPVAEEAKTAILDLLL
jgi:hypothetical protein